MSEIECQCGYKTNTALSDWVDVIGTGKAEKCYARWSEVDKCWIKGCATDKGFMRNFADKTIERQSLKCEVFDE